MKNNSNINAFQHPGYIEQRDRDAEILNLKKQLEALREKLAKKVTR